MGAKTLFITSATISTVYKHRLRKKQHKKKLLLSLFEDTNSILIKNYLRKVLILWRAHTIIQYESYAQTATAF